MTNQEYLRGTFFGAGLPVRGIRSLESRTPQRVEFENGDFSFLLKLGDLQRSGESDIVDPESIREDQIFENRQLLKMEVHLPEFSLAEFERDMDLIAEGLENIGIGYQGTYPRADIYLDHD